MQHTGLARDPYNLIITGVGGQGNVLASKLLGSMLLEGGFRVTIGETFGASQRGGSVMSHVRVSYRRTWSPQIPKQRADVILALEPMEALRVVGSYGHPDTLVITNSRPVYPMAVIAGERSYRDIGEIQRLLERCCRRAWMVDATERAVELGAPIYANIIMIGALSALKVLPLTREGFQEVFLHLMGSQRVEVNLEAFDVGWKMLQAA